MTIEKGHTMKISQRVIRFLCLFGLWLGIGLQVHAQTDAVTYVYTDPQGTPLVKADAQGNVIARYDYTPYGNAVTSLGNPPNGPGYTGHVNDPETGLVYMEARYYQPIGRFPSPDPVGPVAGNVYSFNRYGYADNNPIVNTDPTGEFPGDTSDCSNSAYPCQITSFGSGVNGGSDNGGGVAGNSTSLTFLGRQNESKGQEGQGYWTKIWHKLEGLTPGSITILRRYEAPLGSGGVGYVYEYQLQNMLGGPLTGGGYAVKESISQRVIWNTTGEPIAPHTSSNIFRPMGNGIGYDLVTAPLPLPGRGTGFEAIYTQRFQIKYSMGVVPLSTVMQHVIEAENGSLIKATATITRP